MDTITCPQCGFHISNVHTALTEKLNNVLGSLHHATVDIGALRGLVDVIAALPDSAAGHPQVFVHTESHDDYKDETIIFRWHVVDIKVFGDTVWLEHHSSCSPDGCASFNIEDHDAIRTALIALKAHKDESQGTQPK
jgi:hypothetical protein